MFNDKCITVFSASSYSNDVNNSSGILNIFKCNDIIEKVVFEPLKRLKKCETNYFKVQSFALKKINRSSLPQISNFKKNQILPSIDQIIIPSSFDNMNRRYYTGFNKNFINNENRDPNKNILLNPRPRKKFGCMINYPRLTIPQISKN